MEIAPIKIKNLRRENKLSQDELARQLGVSRQTIFAIETGRSEPSLSLALKLCTLFDTAIDELFDEVINNEIQSTRKGVGSMPNIIQWSPVSHLTDLHREIDRFFEDAVSAPKQLGSVPAMNVRDNGKEFAVEVAIPGFTQEDIDIEAGPDFLTIRGEKKNEVKEDKQGYLKREFSHAKFERSIALPVDIQSDKVEASIEHGTLKVTLPKIEPTQPQVTKVKFKSSK